VFGTGNSDGETFPDMVLVFKMADIDPEKATERGR
jgi:hypothetical protein